MRARHQWKMRIAELENFSGQLALACIVFKKPGTANQLPYPGAACRDRCPSGAIADTLAAMSAPLAA
jgi:hypothetical protein